MFSGCKIGIVSVKNSSHIIKTPMNQVCNRFKIYYRKILPSDEFLIIKIFLQSLSSTFPDLPQAHY